MRINVVKGDKAFWADSTLGNWQGWYNGLARTFDMRFPIDPSIVWASNHFAAMDTNGGTGWNGSTTCAESRSNTASSTPAPRPNSPQPPPSAQPPSASPAPAMIFASSAWRTALSTRCSSPISSSIALSCSLASTLRVPTRTGCPFS
mgnify:CR=1 FL=1